MNEAELKGLHSNQRLLVQELQARGVDVRILRHEMELLEANYGSHRELILDRDSSINPYPASVIAGDKALAKEFLKAAGISVPMGDNFNGEQITEALLFAQRIGFPLIAKPCFGSHGDNVHTDLENLSMVDKAIGEIVDSIGKRREFLIEEQFEGAEHRVFITKRGDYAVLQRDPAHVIGDGTKTIEQLANDETYKRTHPRSNSLCPILIDNEVSKFLAKHGMALNSVPKQNQKVYLRRVSNVAKGGVCEDFTDKVHPSVIDIAKRALAVFPGMPYAGVDILIKDSSQQQTPNSYVVLEVNSVPGIHMHINPGIGQARNVAKYLADMMFPETTGVGYGRK